MTIIFLSNGYTIYAQDWSAWFPPGTDPHALVTVGYGGRWIVPLPIQRSVFEDFLRSHTDTAGFCDLRGFQNGSISPCGSPGGVPCP